MVARISGARMDIREQIRQFIVTNFYIPDAAALTDDALLLETGVVDSTGILEVISFIEETFQMKVADAEMIPENLGSIVRIGDYVGRKKAEQG
jgi:acyl carrier protein